LKKIILDGSEKDFWNFMPILKETDFLNIHIISRKNQTVPTSGE